MENSLLATKLFAPPERTGLVSRPRLIDHLQNILHNRLTLVSAPAGFGKTTLLSEWTRHQRSGIPVVWLSLEESESDPIRFWEYFISAIKKLQPRVGDIAASFLHSMQTIPIESILTALINDLAGISHDLVLVLDDYQNINSPPIHNGISFILKHSPSKLHLVIATRIDPPLPLSHYRGEGSILEIRADDLRFNVIEASMLLHEMDVPDISPENIDVLVAKTEGWAVGLKMAALSLKTEKNIPHFIAGFTGSQRYIMDYLIEDVLQQQSQELKDFLLQTSILDKLSGPLCDAVTGRNNGRETLLGLEKANLFIVPLDETRKWYRYEILFVDLLRHQLEIERGKETVKALQLKASKWYEQQGLSEDSIHHALQSQDWQRALSLISNPEVFRPKWRTLTMYNWLRLVPEDILKRNLTLTFSYIWALESAGQYELAETWLAYLENTYPGDHLCSGRAACIRTAIAVDKGDVFHAEEYAIKALSNLPPEDPHSWRGLISVYLAVIYMYESQYQKAEPLMTEAYEYTNKNGDAFNGCFPLTWLGFITFMRGNLLRAEEKLKEVAGKKELNLAAGLYAHMILFSVYYELNDLYRAEKEIETAVALTKTTGGLALIYPHLYRTRLCLARKDIQGAAEAIKDADLIIEQNQGGWSSIVPSRFDLAHHAGYHLALAKAQGDNENVTKWVNKLLEYYGFVNYDPPYYAKRLCYLRKGKSTAQENLQREYDKFAQTGYFYIAVAIRLSQALLADTASQALFFLHDALTRGKSIGLVRTFVDEGLELAPLLKQAIDQDLEPEYALKLLNIIEAEEVRRKLNQGNSSILDRSSDFMSEREQEVLRLLADEISNEQIAHILNISLSTVKTHVHHILEKLEVKDRSQAVARAREIKLL